MKANYSASYKSECFYDTGMVYAPYIPIRRSAQITLADQQTMEHLNELLSLGREETIQTAWDWVREVFRNGLAEGSNPTGWYTVDGVRANYRHMSWDAGGVSRFLTMMGKITGEKTIDSWTFDSEMTEKMAEKLLIRHHGRRIRNKATISVLEI